MARIAGVNIPTNKRVIVALTYIHGIGPTKARAIANKLGIVRRRESTRLRMPDFFGLVRRDIAFPKRVGVTAFERRCHQPGHVGIGCAPRLLRLNLRLVDALAATTASTAAPAAITAAATRLGRIRRRNVRRSCR